MTPVLELNGICKSFGGVTALEDISLSLYPGEVLGLLGDNGAGKSTLMKIISGVIPADEGQISIRGTAVDIKRFSVAGARDSGIESVHQDRALGEKQPIWRNLFMGRH
ncbi:MAG: ATP-binding cassette domain-containing protein, partial [Desulfobacterales bacterium]|nr:ATP-binding cassette domain-containing protein [Desulfobacterales bacterium]